MSLCPTSRIRSASTRQTGLDFRLKPGSPPVDAGIVLPSINDDYTERAPDIGAYESGPPLPLYGPRR